MKKFLFTVSVFAVPLMTFAQVVLNRVPNLANKVIQIVNTIIPVLVALAVFWVIYGAFQFVMSAGDEEKRKEGKNKILYGVIGIFIMLSVWGLVNILTGSFWLDNAKQVAPTVPDVIP